jgi:Domain of unknown function (DUF4185)
VSDNGLVKKSRVFGAVAGIAVICFQAACGSASVSAPRPLRVATVEDMGPLSMPARVTGRDGGASALIRGRLLFTFGDTFLTAKAEDGTTLRSATGAWSDPQAPLALSETLDAAGLPQQLIPYTTAEVADNARDVRNGWALWPGPILFDDGQEALIVFQQIRRRNGSDFSGQGIGVARVVPGETRATRDAALLFVSPEPLFGSGGAMVDATHVYLYECSIIGYLNMGCRLARAERAQADQRAAYRYYDGTGWSTDITQAKVVIEHAASGITVHWNAWIGQYVAVHSELLGNRIQLRSAPHPEGPWSGAVTIETSAGGILPAAPASSFNYLAQEHQALSSTDGRTIVVGYSRPLAPFRGEVRLARVTLGD